MNGFSLPSQLTHTGASACCAQFGQWLEQGSGPARIDLSGLTQFDSSALAVLLDCKRQALAAGRSLEPSGWPDRLQELARLYGVLAWLDPTHP